MSEMQPALAATPEDASAQWSKLYRDDAEFRAEFDRDPRAAMGAQMGAELPDDVGIMVHRQNPGEIHITVPAEGAAAVSEADLSQVSGGAGIPGMDALAQAVASGNLPGGAVALLIPAFMLGNLPGLPGAVGGSQP